MNLMKNTLMLLLCIVLFIHPITTQAKELKVVFLNPGFPSQNTTGHFWQNVTRFMEAAAADLSINLVTLYSYRNHVLMQSQVEQILSHEPDYVVLVNEKGKAKSIAKQLVHHNIPIFMLLNSFNEQELLQLSAKVRQGVVGSLLPNNFTAGKKLLTGLISLNADVIEENHSQFIYVLALQGDFATAAAIQRQRGFNQVVSETKQLIVVDSTVANWDKEQAYQKVKGVLKRQHLDIIWAANDAMAFGAKKAIEEINTQHPIIIGGINWDVGDPHYPVNLSYGGHVSLGAYALVMISDIESNILPCSARHQIVDIFEASDNENQQVFSQALLDNNLEQFQFEQFSLQNKLPVKFSVNNMIMSKRRH